MGLWSSDSRSRIGKGQVVAQGNHEELLLDSPIYAEIYHTQLLGECEILPELCLTAEAVPA